MAHCTERYFEQIVSDERARCVAARSALLVLLAGELAAAGSTDAFANLLMGLAAAAWHKERSDDTIAELVMALGEAQGEMARTVLGLVANKRPDEAQPGQAGGDDG